MGHFGRSGQPGKASQPSHTSRSSRSGSAAPSGLPEPDGHAPEVKPSGVPDTVGPAIRWGAFELQRAGVDTPSVDSRLLMSYALAGDNRRGEGSWSGSTEATLGSAHATPVLPRIPVSATELFFEHDRRTPDIFAEWVSLRCQRIPLQHIVGAAVFDGVDYLSRPGAFIPRPETELLVDWAFHEALRRHSIRYQAPAGAPATGSTSAPTSAITAPVAIPQSPTAGFAPNDPGLDAGDSSQRGTGPISVVDLCTGPGTIALALACRFSDANRSAVITGIELHEEALHVARANEAQLRHRGLIADAVELRFHCADVLNTEDICQLELGASPDVIVSNPPYVPSVAEVSPEVRHDPADAVFSGESGMDFIPGLVKTLGFIAGGEEVGVGIEHDDANGAATMRALATAGVYALTQHSDIAGRDRFVTGTWPAGSCLREQVNPSTNVE